VDIAPVIPQFQLPVAERLKYDGRNVGSKAAICWTTLSGILDCGVRFVNVKPLFQATEYAVVDVTVAF
jgi:hypothetical protein